MSTEIVTLDSIANELRALLPAFEASSDALKHAELAYDTAQAAWQDAYDDAFSESTGTVAEREIAGRMATRGYLTDERNERRSEVTRVKQKIKSLEAQQSNLQTQSKAILGTYEGSAR